MGDQDLLKKLKEARDIVRNSVPTEVPAVVICASCYADYTKRGIIPERHGHCTAILKAADEYGK